MPSSFKHFLVSAWEVLEVVFIAAATVFLIRSFLVQPFLVSGASMEPTFQNGNYLIVDEISYRFREPARGEVVVFRYPKDPNLFFIKRIIGLPGEHVVGRNGVIAVYKDKNDTTGIVLNEAYIAQDKNRDSFDIWLNGGEYFVLGDNRNFSFDSRSWGPVAREYIDGVVRLRVFPFDTFTTFTHPSYTTPALAQ